MLTPARKRGQSGCSAAIRPRLALHGERGVHGAPGVVGLVAARVEGGHDRVADQTVDLAAVLADDRRDRHAEDTR